MKQLEKPVKHARITGIYEDGDTNETFMIGMIIGGVVMFLMCLVFIFPLFLAFL